MSQGKMILSIVGGFAGVLILIFLFELIGLGMFGFFAPKYEDVKRNTFENTKSYVQGSITALAKRYGEWQEADRANITEDRTAIEQLIKMEFAAFDETKIKNDKLRNVA